MSWTRSHDDTCEVKRSNEENVTSLTYVMDPIKYYSCSPCRPVKGILAGNEVSVIQGNMVDLESELYGMFNRRTRCDASRHLPSRFPSGDDKTVHVCDKCPRGTNPGFCPHRDPSADPINANLDHLPECKFFDFPRMPPQPTFSPFTCAGPK